MAVTILQALFLTECWQEGARFDTTLTLARQSNFLTLGDVARLARMLPAQSEFAAMAQRGEVPAYVDDLLLAMGAQRVDAMDASDFEGAPIVHDLNEPLPPHLHSQYDAVIDGGTLEHVFNVPGWCRNVMDALKVGGHFYAALPANNWCGHGFYQFSAEFFYNVFSPENGFRMRKLYVAPFYAADKWLDGPVFKVADPKDMRDRVQIEGRRKMTLLVQAEKVEQRPAFTNWPQQSDYAALWAQAAGQQPQSDMLAGAQPPVRKLLHKMDGVRRVFVRWNEQRLWAKRSMTNPALKPHAWRD